MSLLGPKSPPELNAPGWLVAAPIAHRGLHDAARGIIENTYSAAKAAMAKDFAIECDVQITGDGEAVVFHDFTLDRLTVSSGRLDSLPLRQITSAELMGTTDSIPTLRDFLTLINGKVPLFCEIKSRFDGDMRLTERTADVVADYAGHIALKSFDPAIIAHLRAAHKALPIEVPRPLGMIAQATYDRPEWAGMTPEETFRLSNFLHYRETRPDFLSYHVDDLPHAVPFLCRHGIGIPVITWTVRTAQQKMLAQEWADQLIFEGDIV